MRRLGLVSSFLLGALAAGCGSDPGAISVSWSVGLSGSCADEGITTVQITLEEEGGSTLGPFEATCTAGEGGGSFKISDVDAGSYTISLVGLDADGNVIYTGRSSSRANVSDGKTATPAPITMSPAPAQLTIQWRFVNGLGCAVQEGEPTQVQVVLFKSNSEETTESAACDDSQLVIGDLEADDDYDVQVTALHGSTRLFRFEQLDIALADGEQRTITGDLLACADIPAGCN